MVLKEQKNLKRNIFVRKIVMTDPTTQAVAVVVADLAEASAVAASAAVADSAEAEAHLVEAAQVADFNISSPFLKGKFIV